MLLPIQIIFKLETAVNTMFTISMAHQMTRAPATAVAIEWRVVLLVFPKNTMLIKPEYFQPA